METIKKRCSNIELLRILAIFFIILHHYSKNNYLSDLELYNMNKYIGIVFEALGKIGVNIFFLITGYFCIEKRFSMKKIVKLWLQVFFYSLGIATFVRVVFNVKMATKVYSSFIFPISNNMYWFINVYIILYYLVPILNKFIKSITKEQFIKTIKILFVLLIVLYSIFYKSSLFKMSELYPYSNIPTYVLIYFIGAYIRLYGIEKFEKMNNKKLLLYTLKWFIIFIAFLISIKLIEYKYNILEDAITYYNRSNSIFVFILAILIFYIFKKINLKENKIINFFASASFGVYLVQSHGCVGGPMLYQQILKTQEFVNSNLLIIHALCSVVAIYLICTIIDYIRRVIFERNIMKIKLFDRVYEKIDNFINI